jgi:hypothetical protein
MGELHAAARASSPTAEAPVVPVEVDFLRHFHCSVWSAVDVSPPLGPEHMGQGRGPATASSSGPAAPSHVRARKPTAPLPHLPEFDGCYGSAFPELSTMLRARKIAYVPRGVTKAHTVLVSDEIQTSVEAYASPSSSSSSAADAAASAAAAASSASS